MCNIDIANLFYLSAKIAGRHNVKQRGSVKLEGAAYVRGGMGMLDWTQRRNTD